MNKELLSSPTESDGRAAMKRLGKAIELRRVELDLKRREVAERAGLSYPYLSEIENGNKNPSMQALQKIAEALELDTASELLALADEDARPDPWTLSSQHLRDSLLTLLTQSSQGTEEADLAAYLPTRAANEARLQEQIATIVRAELGAWMRTELPGIVDREVARALARDRNDAH